MNILRLSKRHIVALLTIMGALSMVIYSTAHASDTPSDHHNSVLDAPYVAPLNAPVTINIQGFAFSPNNITITTGTMVTWTNLDGATHTSTSLTSVWNSGNLSQNQSFSFTFNSTGVFPYRCNIHTSMTASITVVDPPTNTPTATVTATLMPSLPPTDTATNTATTAATNTATATATSTNTATVTASITVSPITPSATFTATRTNTPVPPRPDTIGVYKDGVFYLRNSNTSGSADVTAAFGGDPADLPVVGDWNGDGVDTIGVYRSNTGFFFLSDSNPSPAVNYTVLFGNPGDAPFAGKWTADMTGSGVGVYRNSNGILYQRKSLTNGFDDFFAIFGNPGDVGVAGDWDGDGFDSIGIYRSADHNWYLSNNSQPSGITFSDINFYWDANGVYPVVGDWDADATSNVGYYNPNSINFYLKDITLVVFGSMGSRPVAGKWVAGPIPPPLSNVSIAPPSNGSNVSGGAD